MTTTTPDIISAEELLFPQHTTSLSGSIARFHNIQAAVAVANVIRPTYGPRGKDKLIISEENITITNGNSIISLIWYAFLISSLTQYSQMVQQF
jgi:chaperonin GroEL (HSP60 family)